MSPLTSSDNAHGHDGIVGNLRVTVMRKLAEGVQDLKLGVGDGDEGQRQWHCPADWKLSVTQLEKERNRRQLFTQI